MQNITSQKQKKKTDPVLYSFQSPNLTFLDLKLEQWALDGYAKTDIGEQLLKECPDEIQRIHCDNYSPEKFISEFEAQNKPCIIQGLTKDWKIDRYWTFEVNEKAENLRII